MITFKPLAKDGLKLLITWFDKPHVKQWWNDELTPQQIKKKYGKRIGDKNIQPFIVYLSDIPIGFIQYYYADKVDNGWWLDATPGTVGIDQFIGNENYINKGYGAELIRLFIKKLFKDRRVKKLLQMLIPRITEQFDVIKRSDLIWSMKLTRLKALYY
jgi:RimJ/RimL family protein N-acetyltransferase